METELELEKWENNELLGKMKSCRSNSWGQRLGETLGLAVTWKRVTYKVSIERKEAREGPPPKAREGGRQQGALRRSSVKHRKGTRRMAQEQGGWPRTKGQ